MPYNMSPYIHPDDSVGWQAASLAIQGILISFMLIWSHDADHRQIPPIQSYTIENAMRGYSEMTAEILLLIRQ